MIFLENMYRKYFINIKFNNYFVALFFARIEIYSKNEGELLFEIDFILF